MELGLINRLYVYQHPQLILNEIPLYHCVLNVLHFINLI